MGRRQIPEIGMTASGPHAPLAEGVFVSRYEDSMHREPARMDPHYHGFYQASLLQGSGRLMHDFRETDIRGLTLFFVSPGQVHTVRPGPGMNGSIVSFTRDFFDGGSDEAARLLLEFPLYFSGENEPWLALPSGQSDSVAIQDLFCQLQTEHDQAAPGAPEIIRALLRILLVKASRIHKIATPETRAGRSATLVREFQLLVEKHFLEETSLAAYARLLGVGINHLNDVVSDVTGRAAGEHIRQRRLLSAKRQLLHSELTIAEVGYRLGFKDPSYFSRFFRRYEGVSPADFRTGSREKYQQDPA